MTNSALDREARLAAFFAADEPPREDPAFAAAVMGRLRLRQTVDLLFEWLTPAIAAIAVAVAMWPVLARIWLGVADVLGAALPLALAAGIAGGSYWLLMRLRLAPPIGLPA